MNMRANYDHGCLEDGRLSVGNLNGDSDRHVDRVVAGSPVLNQHVRSRHEAALDVAVLFIRGLLADSMERTTILRAKAVDDRIKEILTA